MRPFPISLTGTQWISAIVAMFTLVVPLALMTAAWCKRRYARSVVALQSSTADDADATEKEETKTVSELEL